MHIEKDETSINEPRYTATWQRVQTRESPSIRVQTNTVAHRKETFIQVSKLTQRWSKHTQIPTQSHLSKGKKKNVQWDIYTQSNWIRWHKTRNTRVRVLHEPRVTRYENDVKTAIDDRASKRAPQDRRHISKELRVCGFPKVNYKWILTSEFHHMNFSK